MENFQQNRQWLLILLFLFCFFVSLSAAEEKPLPAPKGDHLQQEPGNKSGGRFIFYGDLAGRINPKGLVFLTGFQYRKVYRYDERLKLEGAYWQTGLGLGLSPAARQAGAHLEWMPWSVLPLRLQYTYFKFSGSSGGLLSFPSSRASYSDEVRDRREDEETGWAQRTSFQPTLQLKIKRFIFRNQTEVSYFQFYGRGPYFLELEEDNLLKEKDLVLANRTQVFWVLNPNRADNLMLIGPLYEITRVRDSGIRQQKLGVGFYWEPPLKLSASGRLYLGLKTGYHLEDPNRQGQMFVVAAVGFAYSVPFR